VVQLFGNKKLQFSQTLDLSINKNKQHSFIGKLAAFLRLQEFSLCNPTVVCSTTTVSCSPQTKSRVGNILDKAAALRINFNIDGPPSVSRSHSPITLTVWHTDLSSITLVSIFRCSSPPRNPVYVRRVNPSALAFRLSSHRHSYISVLFSFRFIVSY
jgi:hypothetical protein